MKTFILGQNTRLKSIAIRVKNRDQMIDFYKMLGFHLKREENELAILGTVEKGSEMLWLEESPRADAHKGEARKMSRFSVVVPTEAEMAEIFARVKKANYPVKDALEDNGRLGFILDDPENNEIEVYCSENKEGQRSQTEELDERALLSQAEGDQKSFSPEVRFDKVHLNVSDLQKQRRFLGDILGLDVKNENDGVLELNEGTFHVGLQEAESGVISLPTHEVHGLDFLTFAIDQESFAALHEHLDKLKQDYFIDGKKSIIAIYDPLGIEWWFVLNK